MATVEIVTLKDYKLAAATLSESFEGDNISNYLFGHIEDSDQRHDAEKTYYECIVYSHILKGLVTAIRSANGTHFDTVAVWSLPSSGNMEDPVTYLRSGYWKLSWKVGKVGRRKIYNELFDMLYETEEQTIGDATSYGVIYVGTRSGARGNGNLKRIFKHMIGNYVEPNRALIYLECSALSNIVIYKKLGFIAVREIQVDKLNNTAPLHIMVRGISGQPWSLAETTRTRFSYIEPSNLE